MDRGLFRAQVSFKMGENEQLLIYLCELLDPNAPKRGLSAYMFFANEQRENVRSENPGIAFGKFFSSFPLINTY